jgi:hypothetical protein
MRLLIPIFAVIIYYLAVSGIGVELLNSFPHALKELYDEHIEVHIKFK